MVEGAVLTVDERPLEPPSLTALLARRWPSAAPRVQATLWWYSSSWNIIDPLVTSLARGDGVVDPTPGALVIGPDGVVVGLGGPRTLTTVPAAADSLAVLCAQVADALCVVTDVGRPSLWAIASDTVANCVLNTHAVDGKLDPSAAEHARLLGSGVGSAMPPPRFVDIVSASSGRVRTFARRNSCCLILKVGGGVCSSCPRRTPADRADRLRALVP